LYFLGAAALACSSNEDVPPLGGSGQSGAGAMAAAGAMGGSVGGAGGSSAASGSGASSTGGDAGTTAATGATGGAKGGASGAAGTLGGAGGNGAMGGALASGGSTSGSAGAAASGGDAGSAGSGGASAGDGGTSGGAGGGAGGASGSSGAGAGGSAGTSSGGACVESSCGSHKWACWKVPNPASSPDTVPNHQHYTDLGNGAVRDDITCLVWEKANPATEGTWQQSFERCAALATDGYAGFDDWRLPTRMEMASITDVTRGSKGYAEPFTVTSGYYNTGSYWYETITGQNTSGFAWAYGTNGFTSNAVVMTNTDNVARCVRGNGSGEAADELAVEPANHYTLEGDAGSVEVADNYTGLVWQQGFSPAIMNWEDAPAYCASLTLNGHTGFRVPTLTELSSTVNEAKVGGAIDTTAFPGNPNGCKEPKYWFWVAEASKVGGTAWGLSYCDGFTGYNVGTSGDWNYFPQANVRCVR